MSLNDGTLQTRKDQSSDEGTQELIRNVLDRVGKDGSRDYDVLQYLQGIAASLAQLAAGPAPDRTSVVTEADANAHTLVTCRPNQTIIVFDILLSINAATNVAFIDDNGNDALATMYAPNAGQGFTMNSVRGKRLPRGTCLRVQSTNAVNYSVDCSYTIIEDIERA